jgi:hypothetical protein
MPGFVGYIETTAKSGYENKHKNQMRFLIYESCFWCASTSNLYFVNEETIPKCPLCDGDGITLIPILRGPTSLNVLNNANDDDDDDDDDNKHHAPESLSILKIAVESTRS